MVHQYHTPVQGDVASLTCPWIGPRPLPVRDGRIMDRPCLEQQAYRWALEGRTPAEALQTADRHRLVHELHSFGWTDVQIASHTRMTLYTTARIRAALGLLPNRPSQNEGVA